MPAESLLTYQVVEMIGGNPYYLLASIRSHNAEPVLREVAERGLLIGWSAGAVVLGPTLAVADQFISPFEGERGAGGPGMFGPYRCADSAALFRQDDMEAVCRSYERKSHCAVVRLYDGEGVLVDQQGQVKKIENKLKVTVAGVEFQNPLIARLGHLWVWPGVQRVLPPVRAGGISCKGITIKERPGNPPPRVTGSPGGHAQRRGAAEPRGWTTLSSTTCPGSPSRGRRSSPTWRATPRRITAPRWRNSMTPAWT